MYMKKTLSVLLLCIAGMLFPVNTYADGEAPADFTGHTWYEYRQEITEGNGSMQNPIIIRTAGQLAQLAYNVNTGNESYKDKVVALAKDINLNKTVDGQRVQWVPIGYDISNCFEGLFVGMDLKDYATNGFKAEQKHKISGVYINVSSASTVKRFGLFGCLGGNVSHLQLENVSINVDLSALNVAEYYFVGGLYGNTIDENNNSGGSDGLWYRGSFLEKDGDDLGKKYVTFATDDVAVSGSISAKGNDQAVIAVGGICGRFDNLGILHSTANVTINTSDCMYVGGICGVNSGLYNKNNSDYGKCLYDCASNATITCNDTQNSSVLVGGIVGQMEEGEKAYACVSMGSIRCTYSDNTKAIHSVGGVCGYMQPGASIFACGSTMFIKSFGNVGGIVGFMKKSANTVMSQNSKVECCSFSGHLDGSRKQIDEKGQTYARLTTMPNFNYIGGICGNLEWDDNMEHITRCLLLGTITNEDYLSSPLPSAIVGTAGSNLSSNVTYCYYDTRLFDGNAIPGSKDGRNSVAGLTTDVLISGDINKVPWLNAGDTEPEHYGYRLEKGYYPIFYENKGYLATYYINYTIRGYSNENLRMLFDFIPIGDVNKNSTVYVPGALLGAMPVTFVKGDCAGDFVSTMSAPNKTYNWEEKGTGRNIIMTCESFFPETEVIRVKDKTATAYNNGTCFVTTTATVRKKTVVYNRPAVMGGTKYISLNSTIDQKWLGDEANGFAGGAGTASDPYLIKNAAQLYRAIKKNKAGQFYKQLCDIIITKSLGDYNDNNTLITEACFSPNIPSMPNEFPYWETDTCTWSANYNGDGHTVSGFYLTDYCSPAPTSGETIFSLFGNVDTNGSINNLAVVDTWIGVEPSVLWGETNNEALTTHYGVIAGKVSGTITNCIAQGINAVGRPCGGICAYVVNNGTVEDCISAVVPQTTTLDQFTPFIAYNPGAGSQGSVKNCLFVTPTTFSSADKSTSDMAAVKNCYWLKGYEPGNTGYTLEEIGEALGSRDRWTWTKDYFPTLKTFANTDIAKLMMVPVRTDKNYNFDGTTQTANNYLLGFKKMLEFEPGASEWDNVHGTNYIEADDELGIIAPSNPMNPSAPSGISVYLTSPMEAIYTTLGKSFYYIPLRTNSSDVERGISFVDEHAEAACVKAFDTNGDGRLSLQEISSVTTEQTLNAFHTTEVQLEGQQIKKFPEFRFFKSVTTLTTQLSGLNNLEEVRLPYNLQAISGDPEFTGNGIRPFSMNKIKDIIIPGKVTTIEPGAFTGSEIENIYVDPFNAKFVSREGILFDNNNALVAFPNGRIGEEITIPGVIEEIKQGAVYDITNRLQKIFFDTTDYSTVADLDDNGIFTGDGSLVDVYISDATYGSVLFNEYLDDESWEDYADANKLHCYYPLKVGSAKAATMYIGFDTELPSGLKAYIVTSDSKEEKLAYLRRMSNQIPNRSPIVIFADEPGTYRLLPLEESLEDWKMYNNQLNGVGRDGMEVYQSDADRGSILTLGRNSDGELGFFYYKGTVPIPPYRAYLTYEWVAGANQYLLFSIIDDDPTGITHHPTGVTQQQDWYTLDGRRINGQPTKRGIYIRGGKKYVVK